MNPFRGKKVEPELTQPQFSIQVTPHQRQEYPSVLPEISQASDFRSSLILKDLSKRFSVLRSPTGEPVTVQDLKYRFAEQRRRGAKNQITEEEEVMLLETLGRMRSRTGTRSEKPQDVVSEHTEPHSNRSFGTLNSDISSSTGKPTKRYSNNLFGSGRLRDYTYFRNAGSALGRTGSARAPSMTPTETSISIQEISDDLQHATSDTSSIRSNRANPFVVVPVSNEQAVDSSSITNSSILRRASMALAEAIKELEEETDDEVVMPRLPRPNPDLSSSQPESTVDLAQISQSSLQSPIAIEAGTAISSDKQVITISNDLRASPVHSRILPGYIPGMPRPMTPRDLDSDDQRSHSTTPRAMSPLALDGTSPVPRRLSSVTTLPQSISPPPTPAAVRASTPSRSTPLFLQRSPSGRRTPEGGQSTNDAVELDNPLNSTGRTSTGSAYQATSTSSRPTTPSNIVWNLGLAEATNKKTGHDRNGSWSSDGVLNDSQNFDAQSSRPLPLPDSPPVDHMLGVDLGSGILASNRVTRSPTPTHGSPRSLAFPSVDISPRNGSKRSSRQNTSSPFLFGQYPPLVLLPVINSSRSSLESVGSSYHSWEGEKDKFLTLFSDADAQQPAWHDIRVERLNSTVCGDFFDEEEWDPEEIIGRYAPLKKSDFKAMQEKLVYVSTARDDARERVPSIRRRRPSTSQSNYSFTGRDRIASPPPASPTTASEQNLRTNVFPNVMADSSQTRKLEIIDTSIQRVPDTEPSPNTRRHRDLAQALFGDDTEREREQTPKPVPLQVNGNSNLEGTETETTSEHNLSLSASISQHTPNPCAILEEADLMREVQEKAEAATAALRKNSPQNEPRLERSILGSISRRRINPSQISEPRPLPTSTSVNNAPNRMQTPNNPGTSKIGSRFKKLRGSLRVKNSPPIGDDTHNSEVHSVASSHTTTHDASKLRPASDAMAAATSASALVSPGLKGFMARLRGKKGGDNSTLDQRGILQAFPSVLSLAASQTDSAPLPHSLAIDSPSSSSSFQQASEQPSSTQPEILTTSDPNEVALRQLFDAASNLGLDQNALNALIARSSSLSRPPAVARDGSSHVVALEKPIEVSKRDQPIMVVPLEGDPFPPQRFANRELASKHEGTNSTQVMERVTAESKKSNDDAPENSENVIVRRTIIYPSDSRSSPLPLDVNSLAKKASHRRRTSMTSTSGKSVQDRAPTPPPPRSPISKLFASGPSPPVPQLPHTVLATAELHKAHPYTRHSFEKPTSAYDSLYEMYSEETANSGGNDFPASNSKVLPNINTDAPALELVELASGETIWSIVNGLRDEDKESMYATRTSFASEFSTREGNPDDLQVYVKEHRKTGSKGSNSSFAARRRLLPGKNRPETKVYYSTSTQIGRLIENLSQGMDSGSFNFSPPPGHSASSSLSLPPSTNDAHWTVEERLEHMLESIANR